MRLYEVLDQWGLMPGTWDGYRSGDLGSPRGMFFSATHDGAWIFQQHSGYPVEKYSLTIKKPYVIENQYYWLAKAKGMTPAAARENTRRIGDLDLRIAQWAKKSGYDSVIYTQPTTPLAHREMVVFDIGQVHKMS